MGFVASRFPLPTVSRPDGSLHGYVRMSPVTSGPALRWPDERLKIYQAQLKAAAAAKKKNWFGLGDAGESSATAGQAQKGSNAGAAGSGPAMGNFVVKYLPWIGGAALVGALVYGLTSKTRTRTGRPIPGAHVYEAL